MELRDELFNVHSMYNLSRYIFLKIENEFSNVVEDTGITLPQLRVLWILKSFPGMSLSEIAQIGCWTPPTVTKILKNLFEKNLVIREKSDNKKVYKLLLTEKGEGYIHTNKKGKKDKFSLFKLLGILKNDEIDFMIDVFKEVSINENNNIILKYIDKINEQSLKIDYSDFDIEEVISLKRLVCFYNLLRTFILHVESNHRQLLLSFDITYPQLRALWYIEAFHGITSVQLSEISFWSPSTANLIVKNLYNKELIYKEKSKVKNALYLFISEKGENFILEDFKINQKNLKIYDSVEKITEEKLSKANNILKKINCALENDKVEDYIIKTFEVIEKRIL